ncbi:MAG: hypothetical protein ACRCXZ_04325 [Patescibacteria group bacterium]
MNDQELIYHGRPARIAQHGQMLPFNQINANCFVAIEEFLKFIESQPNRLFYEVRIALIEHLTDGNCMSMDELFISGISVDFNQLKIQVERDFQGSFNQRLKFEKQQGNIYSTLIVDHDTGSLTYKYFDKDHCVDELQLLVYESRGTSYDLTQQNKVVRKRDSLEFTF